MTILKLSKFDGMIPKLPSVRLPDTAAEIAVNCNFSHGELRSLSGPAPKIATNIAVRSLFTDDGLRFYAWDVPTRAYRSPTIDDVYSRVYYSSEGAGMRVAQMTGAYPALSRPRAPASSWIVGVARPEQKPTSEIVPTIAWNQDVGASARITALSMLAGAEVASQVASIVSTQAAWQRYTVSLGDFDLPGSDGNAEASPSAVVDGWIEGGDNLIAYMKSDVSMNGGETIAYQRGANFLAAGLWRVRQDGTFQVRGSTSSGWVLGSIFLTTQVDGLQYKGNLYATPSKLFSALKDGTASTASPSTDAEKALTDAQLAFRFEVIGSDNTLLFSTDEVTFVESGDNYAITISYALSDKTTIAYVTTFENDWGEESAPSDPIIVDVLPFQDVIIKQWYKPWAGQRNIAGMNLYRTYPGASAEYIKANVTPRTETVVEGGVVKWAIMDSTETPNTATVLRTQEWDSPPTNLSSLTYAGNGFFAGASGKDLRFSEPYHPHAWPYYMTFPHVITGIVEIEGGLLVTTAAQPYIVRGAHPEQMSQQALNAEQAGVSSRSMTKVSGSAAYVSNDGLVMVSGGQASLDASQQLFTREDWRRNYKAAFRNMSLGAWDGQIVGVVDPSNKVPMMRQEHFILRLDQTPSFSYLDVPGTLLGTAISASTDEFYLLYTDGFAEFGIGAGLDLLWSSKVFEYPRPVFFGAGIVRHSGSFEIWLDDKDMNQSHRIVLTGENDKPFRLPTMMPSKRWQVTIRGRGVVHSIEFGASFGELQNG